MSNDYCHAHHCRFDWDEYENGCPECEAEALAGEHWQEVKAAQMITYADTAGDGTGQECWQHLWGVAVLTDGHWLIVRQTNDMFSAMTDALERGAALVVPTPRD